MTRNPNAGRADRVRPGGASRGTSSGTRNPVAQPASAAKGSTRGAPSVPARSQQATRNPNAKSASGARPYPVESGSGRGLVCNPETTGQAVPVPATSTGLHTNRVPPPPAIAGSRPGPVRTDLTGNQIPAATKPHLDTRGSGNRRSNR